MDKFLILKPFLRKIADGKFFKTIFSWAFRINACFIVLAALFASWKLWAQLSANLPAKYFIGALLAEIFLVAIGFIVFNILWIRSNDIQNLPSVKDYSVTPIMVISIKATGEIWASLSILFGLAMTLTTWISGPEIMRMIPFTIPLPGISGSGQGASSILPLISGAILGFGLLATSYFIAEMLGALVDIARNTKKGR